MFKTAGAGEDHGDAIFVAGVDYFLIPNGSARLDHHFNSRIFDGVNAISKWEKRIGRIFPISGQY